MSTKINTSPLVKTYTLEEFWQLPDPPEELELIAGVLYMSHRLKIRTTTLSLA